MRSYRVRFTWGNGRYEETMTATSAQAARSAIEMRYPGATAIAVTPA
ncbi:MAG: hypothetical protein HON70_47715 [Lentisphaerae bacterium]|jgi:hypothetical protein|nr:hypothetical protein [Lentisphaerota bacterium]